MQFLMVSEVAELLRVTPETVREWLRGGELRGLNLGGRWRVLWEDLQEFVKDRQNKPGQ